MVRLQDVLSLISDFTKRTGYPFPISTRDVYSWAEPLNLPRKGDTLLYTGALYQLVPYIEPLIKRLEDMEKGKGATMLKLARIAARAAALARIAIKPEKELLENSKAILTNIAKLLKKAGVKVAYLYDDELYNGALLYDFGLDDVFVEQIKRVYEKIKAAGAKTIITVDPHTTNTFRTIAPKYIENFDLEVKSYLEVLAEKLEKGEFKPERKLDVEVVIHDPCLYARYENVIEPPRKLLEAAGAKVLEPPRTREMTYCCGGLLESIAPSIARKIAGTRAGELEGVCKRIVTMCPICLVNFLRVAGAGVEVKDVSSYLAQAYL